jgi:hypothetical protein
MKDVGIEMCVFNLKIVYFVDYIIIYNWRFYVD